MYVMPLQVLCNELLIRQLHLSILSSFEELYRSIPGKHPWALKRNSWFWAAWALTRDQNSIRLYRSCYSGPLKCSTWVLTWEWVLARDTTVCVCVCVWVSKCVWLHVCELLHVLCMHARLRVREEVPLGMLHIYMYIVHTHATSHLRDLHLMD